MALYPHGRSIENMNLHGSATLFRGLGWHCQGVNSTAKHHSQQAASRPRTPQPGGNSNNNNNNLRADPKLANNRLAILIKVGMSPAGLAAD